MTTETVLPRDRLTNAQLLEIQDFQSVAAGILTPADYWVAAQEAVLQSPEVQRLREDEAPELCQRCLGAGTITILSDASPDAQDVEIDCDHCGGSGSLADAAKNLSANLTKEKFNHMQLWAEYRNFHRSLCARFGYSHDPAHFRRDLVSLEEAIAAQMEAYAAAKVRQALEDAAKIFDEHARITGLHSAMTEQHHVYVGVSKKIRALIPQP